MLQIDHVYEFLYQELFRDFEVWYIFNGVPKLDNINIHDISIFTRKEMQERKIFLFDQEPVLESLLTPYLNLFSGRQIPSILATSEKSETVNDISKRYNFFNLYYFFHGFAALDWYRGYYSLNYNKQTVKVYNSDYISYNRLITKDRSYRIYFVSLLKEKNLLDQGQVSFNVTDNLFDDWQDEVADPTTKLSEHARQHAEQYLTNINKLVIDNAELPGSASANIPRSIESWMPEDKKPKDINGFWHIVTETVFYYNKLHLTEKIFKPIVSKQPFMLLAAPGNLQYLRSYGFKTFDGIIDESYDSIKDNDQRTEAVVKQLHWYCNLSQQEKNRVIEQVSPIVEHNFHHFYGNFKHIITKELLDNCKELFKKIGYNDNFIEYEKIYHVLTN